MSSNFAALILRATPNRARRGLYAGRGIGFGNKISHSERKTRRSWKPNVKSKRLWSDALQQHIRFNVTTTALRCIDKAGGLDNYLLHTHPKKLDSDIGMRYRGAIAEALAQRGLVSAVGVNILERAGQPIPEALRVRDASAE